MFKCATIGDKINKSGVLSTELQTEMQKALQGKDVTLVGDGRSNVHNDPVTATCVHVNGKSLLVKATDNRSANKTAKHCKDQCSGRN